MQARNRYPAISLYDQYFSLSKYRSLPYTCQVLFFREDVKQFSFLEIKNVNIRTTSLIKSYFIGLILNPFSLSYQDFFW